MNDLELISAKVHEQWMENKRKAGVTSRKLETGEELMVPYEQLSEAAKELDRGSVRAVLQAQDAIASGGSAGAASAEPTAKLATYLLNTSPPDWQYDDVIAMAAEAVAGSAGLRERLAELLQYVATSASGVKWFENVPTDVIKRAESALAHETAPAGPCPSKRQIVFNWLMDEDLSKTDGYWGGADEVARVDTLLAALNRTAPAGPPLAELFKNRFNAEYTPEIEQELIAIIESKRAAPAGPGERPSYCTADSDCAHECPANEPRARMDELKDAVIALCDPQFTVEQRKAYITNRMKQLRAAALAPAPAAEDYPGQDYVHAHNKNIRNADNAAAVKRAFQLIADANTVTILSLSEMQSVVLNELRLAARTPEGEEGKQMSKREMRLWLRTFGGCHERLCGLGQGWGFCTCILAQALRKFELELCVRKRRAVGAGKERKPAL